MLRVTGWGQRQDPSPVPRPAPPLSSLLPHGPSLLLGQEQKGSQSAGEPGASGRGAGSPAVVGWGLEGAASGGVVGGSQTQQLPQPGPQCPPRDGRRDEERKADFSQEEEGRVENGAIGKLAGRRENRLSSWEKTAPPEVLVENERKTSKIWGHLGASRKPLGDTRKIICRTRGAGGQGR